MLLAEWGTGQVLWSILWFTLFFIWIWLLIIVFADIFRSHDLSGWAKALWILFIVLIWWLGVLVYFIVRGDKMRQHAIDDAKAQDAAMRNYVASVAGSASSPADQLARLNDLKTQGAISEDEFQAMKAKIVAS